MKKIALLLLLLSLSITPAWAITAEEKGLKIAQKADELDTGWGDQKQSLVMILRNKQGQESRRQIHGRELEVIGDGDKSMSIFDTPADIKGTAFLSFTHVNKPDDQWLYLPALKRVKRIASKNKSGPFMGSEFAFEDMSSQEVGKYTYKWLRDEKLDGKDVYVIERVPVDKYSGYTRQIVWGDKVIYRPLKVEFYDRKNSLLKTLTLTGYKQYLDKYWRADRMQMVNHQNGKSTLLIFSDYSFKNGYTDRDFDRNSLKRAR
ncbi:MAG: outer membrane lipoprotein-sorting protein [Gammaproteobacteria bacterium]|nr:outer membrane lipoprotein-sorting protein [Gammaproteobacteria bacterium]